MIRNTIFFTLIIAIYSCSGTAARSDESDRVQNPSESETTDVLQDREEVFSLNDTIVLELQPCNIPDLVRFIDAPVVTSHQVETLLRHADANCDLRNVELSEVYNEALNMALSANPEAFFSGYCLVSNKSYIENLISNPISDKFVHVPSNFTHQVNACPSATKLIESIEASYSKY